MNNQEVMILKKNGIDYQRIENLKKSLLGYEELKRINKKLETKIINQEKEIESLNKKIKDNKNKNLIEGLKEHTKTERIIKETKGATLTNIKRVIKFTEIGKEYTKSDFHLELFIDTTCVAEIIDFLNKYTNVKFEIINGRYRRCQ